MKIGFHILQTVLADIKTLKYRFKSHFVKLFKQIYQSSPSDVGGLTIRLYHYNFVLSWRIKFAKFDYED